MIRNIKKLCLGLGLLGIICLCSCDTSYRTTSSINGELADNIVNSYYEGQLIGKNLKVSIKDILGNDIAKYEDVKVIQYAECFKVITSENEYVYSNSLYGYIIKIK